METESGFSVLIPSWNNLALLQLCLEGIRENSKFPHEVIVFVNEGKDGTAAWLKSQNILHIVSSENLGVCKSLNRAAEHATRDWVLFLNDDMYVLPGWDTALYDAIKVAGEQPVMLSATMIEPRDTGNPCVIVKDYGRDLATFRKPELLREFLSLEKKDWSGSSWPPSLVSRRMWNQVGGYSEEFSPGMSSDPDFSMKMWKAGVRYFRGVGKSRVYHFQAKSTGRIVKNNGRLQFLHKWGIAQSVFYQSYLRMGQPFEGPLPEPQGLLFFWGRLRSKIKRLLGPPIKP